MDDPAWYEGCEDWVKIKDIPGIKTESKGHNLTDTYCHLLKLMLVTSLMFLSATHTRILSRYLRKSVL